MVVDVATIIALVNAYGYLGVFAGSLITSLSLFFPIPGFAFVITAGAFLDPLWVGIFAGLGSAIGEMLGYPIGRGIHYGFLRKKKKARRKEGRYEHEMVKIIREWFSRKRGPLIIFLFAVTPLPDDFAVIFCGMIKYDVKKLFLSLVVGKIIFSLALAYAGSYGFGWVSGYL
jgi:membrane protein YqaA with SNARE-associated domain